MLVAKYHGVELGGPDGCQIIEAAAIRDITGGEQMDTGEVGGIGQGEFDRLVCHGD